MVVVLRCALFDGSEHRALRTSTVTFDSLQVRSAPVLIRDLRTGALRYRLFGGLGTILSAPRQKESNLGMKTLRPFALVGFVLIIAATNIVHSMHTTAHMRELERR